MNIAELQKNTICNIHFQHAIGALKKEITDKIVAVVEKDKILKFNKKQQLISTIEDIILDIVKEISKYKSPYLVIRNQRLWSNCFINDDRLELKDSEGTTSLEVKYGPKASKEFAHMIYLLGRIHKLLITNSTCTKRELYYENTNLFDDQSQLDSVADKVCCLLKVAQWDMGLFATSKGIVAGALYITTPSGDVLDCSSSGGILIPQDLSGVQLQSSAQFVLVVEKDAAFQRLQDEGFLESHAPCIMVTGKGYPDLNTRLLVKSIWEQLQLPILTLVDADPYGIEIMCVYRFGSLKQSHIGDRLAIPSLKWLGIHPSDILELNIDSSPLSGRDERRIDNLLTRPYISDKCSIRKQVNKLSEMGKKSEIEDIAKISNGYLTDVYIPMKICSHQLI